jgi:hypothetical protein
MMSSKNEIERELRVVERLIDRLSPNNHFFEDLVCLELHRKALTAALAIESATPAAREHIAENSGQSRRAAGAS